MSDEIIASIPGLTKTKHEGTNLVSLIIDTAFGKAIFDECYTSVQDTQYHIYRITQTIRKEMFNSRGVFDGDVSIKRQQESVPSLLIQLLSVILEGEKADIDSSPGLEKIVTNGAQIIRYHAVKKRRAVKTFRASCAPPLLIATGLRAYSDNKSKKLVDDLASEGLSISYKRVKSIRKAITQQICY